VVARSAVVVGRVWLKKLALPLLFECELARRVLHEVALEPRDLPQDESVVARRARIELAGHLAELARLSHPVYLAELLEEVGALLVLVARLELALLELARELARVLLVARLEHATLARLLELAARARLELVPS